MRPSRMFLAFVVISALALAAFPAASASPTLVASIEDIILEEDTPLTDAINLNNYFSNGETELTYSFFSSDNKIDIRIKEDQSVDITSPKDWFGAEEITFTASAGENEVSDTCLVFVEPVNDAPELFSPISGPVSFDEDNSLVGVFNLNQHFRDIDSELSFSYSSENIDVTINLDGTVDLSAPSNWHGSEEVVFTAFDGELEVSETVLVNVNPVNDVPVNLVNINTISLSETNFNTLEMDRLFSDYDDDNLIYRVSGNSEIKCTIDSGSNQLRMQAPKQWTGKELITITASDSQGASQSTQFVVISSRGSDYSAAPLFYVTGLVLALAVAGVKLQTAGRNRHIRSPVKLESYGHYKGPL